MREITGHGGSHLAQPSIDCGHSKRLWVKWATQQPWIGLDFLDFLDWFGFLGMAWCQELARFHIKIYFVFRTKVMTSSSLGAKTVDVTGHVTNDQVKYYAN